MNEREKELKWYFLLGNIFFASRARVPFFTEKTYRFPLNCVFYDMGTNFIEEFGKWIIENKESHHVVEHGHKFIEHSIRQVFLLGLAWYVYFTSFTQEEREKKIDGWYPHLPKGYEREFEFLKTTGINSYEESYVKEYIRSIIHYKVHA